MLIYAAGNLQVLKMHEAVETSEGIEMRDVEFIVHRPTNTYTDEASEITDKETPRSSCSPSRSPSPVSSVAPSDVVVSLEDSPSPPTPPRNLRQGYTRVEIPASLPAESEDSQASSRVLLDDDAGSHAHDNEAVNERAI